MTFEEYQNYLSRIEKPKQALQFLMKYNIYYASISDLKDYIEQEKSINPNQSGEILNKKLENIKTYLLRKHTSEQYYEKLKEALDIYCNYVLNFQINNDLNLSPYQKERIETQKEYYTSGQKKIGHNIKVMLKEIFKELGLEEIITVEAFLLNFIIIMENLLKDYHFHLENDTASYEVIKKKLKEKLGSVIKFDLNETSETVKINFMNDEILGAEENIISTFKNPSNLYYRNRYEVHTFIFNKKDKSLSYTTNKGEIIYLEMRNEVKIEEDIRTIVYNQISQMQADFGLVGYNAIPLNEFNKLELVKPFEQYRLIIAPNKKAYYSLIENGEEIFSLSDIDVIYDEVTINTLNFMQYINDGKLTYTDFKGAPYLNLSEQVKKELNKLKVRYIYSCNDLRFSCVIEDFSMDEMWKIIEKEKEKARIRNAVKKYERRNFNE